MIQVKTPEHLQPDDSKKSDEPNALHVPSDTSRATTSIFEQSLSAHSVESLTHMEVQTASNEDYPHLPKY